MAKHGFKGKSGPLNTSLDSSAFMSDQTDTEQSDSETVSTRIRPKLINRDLQNSQDDFRFTPPLAVAPKPRQIKGDKK